MPYLTFHEDKDKATVTLKNINIYPSSAVIYIFFLAMLHVAFIKERMKIIKRTFYGI